MIMGEEEDIINRDESLNVEISSSKIATETTSTSISTSTSSSLESFPIPPCPCNCEILKALQQNRLIIKEATTGYTTSDGQDTGNFVTYVIEFGVKRETKDIYLIN